MDRKVYIDTIGMETRRLVMEDGVPVEYAVSRQDAARLTGNIYLGRVENILKGMHAAFVHIGHDKNAFLSLDDMPPVLRDAENVSTSKTRIPLKQGQDLIVQVTKEPGGDKGPRVTMNPTFPGVYAVLLPTVQAIGVSRHIVNPARREALLTIGAQACPEGMGLILRTASEEAAEADIAQEVHQLHEQWQHLYEHAAATRAPALLYAEGDLTIRAERDLHAPILQGPFDASLETRLEKDLGRKVWLSSGAYLVIDRTEAMTVIDVNSGKYTGKKNLNDTLLRLNCEAAREIARQIRLRDIGGIILIDFVDMSTEADRETVLRVFMDASAQDRGKRHVHGFTGAGLLELTRRPAYQPIRDALLSPCPCCHGEGVVSSVFAQAHQLLRQVRQRRLSGDESQVELSVSQPIHDQLMAIGLPDNVALTIAAQKGNAG